MTYILKDSLKSHAKTVHENISLVNDLLPALASSFWAYNRLVSSGMVDYWTDLCIKESDNDGKRTPAERITALSLLAEIWQNYVDHIDSRENIVPAILALFKKAVRDRNKSLRMSSAASMFKTLEILGEHKHP
jgi:hypothetical protein